MPQVQPARLVDGKVVDALVTDKVNAKIENGALTCVEAIVVHQTGAPTAQSSFESYKTGQNGAHFLIDRTGEIYQTARINQICWHVSQVRADAIN